MRTTRHNPFVSAAALLLGAVLVMFLVGCEPTVQAASEPEPRFTVRHDNSQGGVHLSIITDNETGNQYLWVQSTNWKAGGLTRLEPAAP